MSLRYLHPLTLLLSGVIMTSTFAPGYAASITGFSNRPTVQIFTPNDKTAEGRKQIAQQGWRQLQDRYSAGCSLRHSTSEKGPTCGSRSIPFG